jgi:Zn-dependent protease with chaperone function
MIVLNGKWYDGQRSAQVDAVLTVFSNGQLEVARADNGNRIVREPISGVQASPRLADTPRFLTFPGGGAFETPDNAGVDQLLSEHHRPHWSRWVHRLETHMRFILPGVVIFVLLAVSAVKYGLPAAAQLIAAHLPESAYQMAGEQTLAVLDRMVLKASDLKPETVQRLRDHLKNALDEHHAAHIRIVFRKGGKIGPNAFALPNGMIIFTDEMVEIARHDDEILAVLAHELGHVVHRHGMRRVVQDSLLSFAVLAITGDASGVSELFLGLPVVLTELAYSRSFEREADRYALAFLQARNIPARRFSDIISRIDEQDKDGKKNEDNRWAGFLSTHPSTRERMEAFDGGIRRR